MLKKEGGPTPFPLGNCANLLDYNAAVNKISISGVYT